METKSYSVFSARNRNQLLATLSANLIVFSHGCALGWLSPTLPALQSNDSPLSSGKISLEEASWIGALLSVGGFIGNVLFGYLIYKIGRKKVLLMITLPHLCFWFTVLFGNHVYHLYAARICAGTCGGGIFITLPIFISEIADRNVRGTLGSMFILLLDCGILGAFIMASYLSYHVFPLVIIGLPIIYFFAIMYFPETPQFLLEQNRIDEAETSLKFYRNYNGTSKEEFQEFNREFSELKLSLLGEDANKGMQVTLQDFCTPAARKGIIISLYLMFLNQFCGAFSIINYSSNIFAESGSNVDPNVNTIVIGVVQILGAYTATSLVDKYGRKILLIISSLGVFLGLTAFGFYSFIARSVDLSFINWMPVASISSVIFVASLGILPLPYLVMTEVLPARIRSIMTTTCITLLSVITFAVLKVYPILMEKIHISGVMWLSGGFCATSILFIYFYLPETKGKSLQSADSNA